jgi:hypothetical protein
MTKVTVTDATTGVTVEMTKVPPPTLVAFYNHERGGAYGGLFRGNAFLPKFELAPLPSQTAVNWLCNQHGSPSLKIADLPAGVFSFEPGNPKVAVCDSRGVWTINEWVQPAIRSKAIACTECPPTIRAVLLHVLGDSTESLERFINWLAVAYKTNRPTGTAWILSGCQLTGKGLLHHQICAPLFGEEYCQQKNATELTDQFNAWLEKCVLLNVDEADFRDGPKNGLDAKMRMWITGPRLSVRGMHEVLREVPNYLNVILTSNLTVVADLPRGDRRFSVSPPQRVQLTAKFPDTDALVKQIGLELPSFAGYLAQYPADAQLARTAMQSVAKAEMIEAAATGPTQFAEALRDGNLQYFVDSYFDLSGRVSRLGEAEDFRATVTGWVKDSIRSEHATPVRTNTLCDIYNLVFRRRDEMTSDGLGKFLGKHGLTAKRMNTKRMCGRGFLVNWKAPADAVPTVEALIAKASGPRRAAESELEETAPDWLNTSPERSLNS